MLLDGIRLLELSGGRPPGVLCTHLLADMGVEVIKIDAPIPAYGGARAREERERMLAYDSENRNKKSVILDLKTESGKQAFYRLADTADAVLEGFKPGTTKRLGIDFETLRARNPRLVYCSLSGLGQDGPDAELGLTDSTSSALRGAWFPVGDTVQTPSWYGVLTADAGGGLHAAMGILAALLARERTGKGTYIDVALADSVSTFNLGVLQRALAGAQGHGPSHLERAAMKCRDGKFLLMADSSGQHFGKLATMLGRPDLADLLKADRATYDRGFADIRAIFLTKDRDEWVPLIAATGTPVAPCLGPEEIVEDPQVIGRGLIWSLDHPTEGRVRQWGAPIKFPEAPARFERFAPRAGQDTAAVLGELGLSPEEIAKTQPERD